MKYHHLVLLCCAFITIFCTRAAYSDDKVQIYTNLHTDPSVIHFSVEHNVELKCNTSETGEITWEKGDKLVTEVSDLKGRVDIMGTKNNTLSLKDLKESDVGDYSCVVTVGSQKYKDTVALATAKSSKWGVRVSKNSNVVEGEPLTLKCEVRGDLQLHWIYKNTTSDSDNITEYRASDDRVKLGSYYDKERKVNVTNGELKIEKITMYDRGEYTCIGLAEDGENFNMTSTVRVKDKYAAVWPFLGICAEVFVLCAIIFIYEKKRNKTELEESDTDQSPDQKNTPDHGKESNLRHRQ